MRRTLTVLSGALLLAATLLATPAGAFSDHAGSFEDDDGSVFEASIEAIAGNDVTRGCNPPSNTRFCPREPVTRGQVATLLRRALHLPGSTTDRFDDDDGTTHEANIQALAAAGITRGCNPPTNSRFCPDDPVTRGQMATLLTRALELQASPTDQFHDDDGTTHETNIQALAAAGITRGCNPPTNSRFCPDDPVTRGQMAAFLARALGLTAEDPTRFEGQRTCDRAYHPCVPTVADTGDLGCPDVRAHYPDGVAHDDRFGDPHGLDADDDGRGCEPGDDGGPAPMPASRTSEGYLRTRGAAGPFGSSGSTAYYTVEIADGLEDHQPLGGFTRFVDGVLGNTSHGWTARGERRLARTDDPDRARVRVLLARPSTVDRLCARAGLDTAGTYSCWNGEFAAINSDRWFNGVDHVPDQTLYRRYVINHEVGHGLGYGHRSCSGSGHLAPVMMQLTKSTYGCEPNGWPYP